MSQKDKPAKHIFRKITYLYFVHFFSYFAGFLSYLSISRSNWSLIDDMVTLPPEWSSSFDRKNVFQDFRSFLPFQRSSALPFHLWHKHRIWRFKCFRMAHIRNLVHTNIVEIHQVASFWSVCWHFEESLNSTIHNPFRTAISPMT